ncbi:Vacuolar protein sorting-associated protein 8 [Ascochyta rabiei]|uniref:Vacuolar protein sorting-associated protein 8 n=1 Tax=Didymella rabiei TaxID=5454 RepID=UPI0019005FDA|nr:Vacuolar protein sorting-associated protein 8 [Ascochyta rabiei]UPX11809.1 Vacuolar protein sorting-associated protein 8 [Ascochyta rabiei]
MSSEPGLGHTSAHNDPDDAIDTGGEELQDVQELGAEELQDVPELQGEQELGAEELRDVPELQGEQELGAEELRDVPELQGEQELGAEELQDVLELQDQGGELQDGHELESVHGSDNGWTFAKTRRRQTPPDVLNATSELSSRPQAARPASLESTSTPDDTPSIQGSLVSSPRSSVAYSYNSPRPNRPVLQPFERRFSSRLSPSPLATPRGASPAFLSAHSRQSSLSSNLLFRQLPDEPDTPQAPWEVVRWTKLKKITAQLFSEVGKRNFGRPTCLHVAASLVMGTSKGFILVFDYQQVLKSIIGPGTKAIECGAITALAISADHSTIAGGHATGHIFTWELSKPAKPFLHIPPLDRASLDDNKSDGHVSGVAILHLGFLGTRHTALVSADDGGMAFSHLATRGLGSIARNVKITRILGRYPLSAKSQEKPRKPSSVLAFAPLPLGNVEQPTDVMGLTALLTPYLLVIVSTTPVAQTQHKAPRPKEVALHSAMSGCLAWFPAVKLKHLTGEPAKAVSKTKLVYCWSNILTVLDVDSFVAPPTEKEKPPELRFKPRSRWRAEEAIVAVQWLSRSVLGVLTISQRLLILEDNTLRTTDSFDLLQKHVYHSDLFSKQLRPVVEQHDEQDASLHGVVADAFYMSFRAYKGRLFLLGFNDVSIGTLSNWADRLVALMEEGDFIAAIGLATSYYVGDADKLTVGLPEDDKARHALVREKLLEMISASLKFAFAQNDKSDDAREARLKELAEVCFSALFSMKELDFLFEDVYEAFEDASAGKPFFETLEPYILDGEIEEVPPDVLKDLITFYASVNRGSQVEEMICRLSTDTLDINEVTTICQQYMLYDALIHVWTQTIGDFITPLTNILDLIKLIDFELDDSDNVLVTSARKIFPYLAYTFTGRFYPGGASMDDEQAYSAKKDMYRFLFSGKNLQWPPGSGPVCLTRSSNSPEPSFPYLHLILEFDASSFMSMLNEAFEDSFLNGEAETSNGMQTSGKTLTPTRQYIVNILLGIMTPEDFSAEDIIYFYMFVARNLPKYPQYIMLPGSSLHQILVGLCSYPTDVVKDDCQLSVEYLLTIHHPPNLQSMVPMFETAGFHRVLKSIYRSAQQYAKLVETYLVDSEDEEAVFGCISDVLRPSKGLAKKQVSEVKQVILGRAEDLVAVDAEQTAVTLKLYAPDLLEPVLDAIEDNQDAQYHYLRALIEPEQTQAGETAAIDQSLPSGFVERYVQLMCTYNSGHVADFVGLLKSGDLKLDPVLPALEKSGVIDAAVVLLARDGLAENAMDRLVKHLGTLETALTGLIAAAADSPDVTNAEEAVCGLLEDIQKYVKVGIWLCQGQTRSTTHTVDKRKSAYGEVREEDLAVDEVLWLDLISTVVKLIKETSTAIADTDIPATSSAETLDTANITKHLRDSVQQTFSALLASTTVPPAKPATHVSATSSGRPPLRHTVSQAQTNPSFLRILRAFLHRASTTYSPSLTHLRSVLAEIFAAYTFEERILGLANSFLDREGFANVEEIAARRNRGWRPRGQVCEGCRGRAWGPGTGAGIWDAWERSEEAKVKKRAEEEDAKWHAERRGSQKGKQKSASQSEEEEGEQVSDGKGKGPLIIFACRHLWHKTCVEAKSGADGRLKCPLCAE